MVYVRQSKLSRLFMYLHLGETQLRFLPLGFTTGLEFQSQYGFGAESLLAGANFGPWGGLKAFLVVEVTMTFYLAISSPTDWRLGPDPNNIKMSLVK